MDRSESCAAEWLVSCLCAHWCGTCRDYRTGFEALAERFPQIGFVWVDVEDEPEIVGDIDVENFPTLVIQRGSLVLFCGPMLPQSYLLERLIESYLAQSDAESRAYAGANRERSDWQGLADVRSRIVASVG